MFKKGFSSLWSSISQIDQLLPAIAQAGFDGIEPTFNPGAIPSPEFYQDDAKFLRSRCFDLGLEIPSMRGGRVFWGTIPSNKHSIRQQALDHCQKACECLAEMGGKTLLVIPGEQQKDVPFSEHWKRVIEFSYQAGDMAQEYGVQIGFENTEAKFPLSVLDWKTLLTEITHANVGMYFDVGNVIWLELGSPEDWLREMQNEIVQIHFKDAFSGGVLVNILEGDVNWPEVMKAIREIHYKGWISVEPEWYTHAPWQLPHNLSANLDVIFRL